MSYNQIGYRNADGVIVTQGQAAVTQASSITTGVTCNAYSGVITTVSQTIAHSSEADFVVTNNKVAATDVISVCLKSTTSAGSFIVDVAAVAAGQFTIRLSNLHASDAGNAPLVISFAVMKAVA